MSLLTVFFAYLDYVSRVHYRVTIDPILLLSLNFILAKQESVCCLKRRNNQCTFVSAISYHLIITHKGMNDLVTLVFMFFVAIPDTIHS